MGLAVMGLHFMYSVPSRLEE